jgi:hypothetical protein
MDDFSFWSKYCSGFKLATSLYKLEMSNDKKWHNVKKYLTCQIHLTPQPPSPQGLGAWCKCWVIAKGYKAIGDVYTFMLSHFDFNILSKKSK